ncbi:MAG: hypothetical protein R3D62_21780 [Xanthobacteraceae bacterium]
MENRAPFGTQSDSGPSAGDMDDAKKHAEQVATDLKTLREDLANLTNTVKALVTQKKDELVGSARDMKSNVASQVSDTAADLANRGSELANSASQQAKTFASEVEAMGRANPLGAMAAALLVGVLIGLMGRGRH